MKRIEAIYQVDKNLSLRKSHENPAIKQLYEEFLGEPNGEKSPSIATYPLSSSGENVEL